VSDITENDSLYGEIGDDTEFRKRYGDHIGSGMSAVIYAHEGIAAKVFREGQPRRQVFQEAFTMAVVGELGIPAPMVYGVETFGERTVLLMDHVQGRSLLDIMVADPEKTGECLDTVVKLQALMHNAITTEFRPIKQVLKGNIIASPGLTPVEKERLLGMLPDFPDEFALCHGDFHGGNILFDGKECIIIDWAEVSCGSPAADASRTYLDYCMYQNGIEEVYLEKYCASTGRNREEILAWLPVMAGALYGYLSEEGKKIARKKF